MTCTGYGGDIHEEASMDKKKLNPLNLFTSSYDYLKFRDKFYPTHPTSHCHL